MIGKEYVYKVTDNLGNYIGVWPDVVSAPAWSQPINTPGATMTVRLARSAHNTIEKRDNLVTNSGSQYITSGGDPYSTVSTTPQTIGAGTDVDLNYNVDVYVVYGAFDQLINTPTLDDYVTSGGDPYIVSTGAPLGRRVFSGIILDYEANYGDQEYVSVTLASYGVDLSNEIIQDGSSHTTVAFTGASPESIVKNILDTNPGTMTYSSGSLGSTALSINQTFQLNTKVEGIQAVYNQTDNGWYWYGNVADNNVYMLPFNTVADHTFVIGKHINNVQIKRSLESLRNTVYFVGGDTGGGIPLYKKFTLGSSVTAWRKGVNRVTDRRFTDATSSTRYGNKILGRYGLPIYTTTVSIPSEVYDIETISLGQMVAFSGFGNFVDSLLLPVVNIDYTPHLITLQLGDLLDRIQDIVIETSDALQNDQYDNLPTIPS